MRSADGSGTQCILVVDDEVHIVGFVTKMLAAQGYTVVSAVTPEKAIEVFESGTAAVDLLLSDVMMPGIKGPELARRFHRTKPDLPVVLMTSYADVPLDGATLLEKPFGFDDLVRTVAQALRNKSES
jgi:two-component system cell cycle sensor histidine kinase/response regulator CckA